MNTLSLIALGGMLLCAAVALLVAALRPPPPQLGAIMTALNAPPVRRPATDINTDSNTGTARVRGAKWLPAGLVGFAERHLGAADADLTLLGRSRAELAVTKIGWAAAGAATPALLAGLLMAGGVRLPFAVPAVASIALALLAWVNPSRQVAQDADKARTQFRAALAVFLALVGLERKARGSPAEALEEASRVSGSRPFAMIHTEVLRAELAAELPWDALRDLGRRIGVDELVNLADIVATAADGAAVFDTLMAEARSMRHAETTAQQTQAMLANERLTLQTVCLFVCFGALLVYPAATRLVGGT